MSFDKRHGAPNSTITGIDPQPSRIRSHRARRSQTLGFDVRRDHVDIFVDDTAKHRMQSLNDDRTFATIDSKCAIDEATRLHRHGLPRKVTPMCENDVGNGVVHIKRRIS